MKRIESKCDYLTLVSSHGMDAPADSECLFEESDFNEMLNRERKRSQRSMKPLILMRLDVSGLKKPRLANDCSKLLKAIATGVRDTDIRGWYKQGSIVGVLFTEIESASPSVREILFRRVMSRLVSQIDPGALFKIKVTFLMYPEGKALGDAVDRFEMKYHKDFVNNTVKFSLSAKIKSIMDKASDFLMT
jgi:hypothetical protein